jgi:hypothetical protein
MKFRSCVLTAAVIAVVGLSAALAQAETWNMASDLHASVLTGAPTNPNGAWTYGNSPTVGGTFEADTVQSDGSAWWGAGVTSGWSKTDNPYLPAIWSVMTGQDAGVVGAVSVAAGEMVIHPNGDTECGVVRWTAPATGAYDVAASWESINGLADYASNAGVDVHLLVNGVSIYDGVTSYLNGTGPATCAKSLSLTAGDTLDFVTSPLGVGTTGLGGLPYACDMTRVGATITAVPEPGTIALLGSAMFGLLVYAWRRR